MQPAADPGGIASPAQAERSAIPDDIRTAGLVVVGGGPAGLMAAEAAIEAGIPVDLFEAKGSVGRKFLIAGRGGLNLTHSEPRDAFRARYGHRGGAVDAWLASFDADAVRNWARRLGIETFVGTSGRVFPMDMKAAPLLRAWLRRLREAGVRFHVRHRCIGWADDPRVLRFATPDGEVAVHAGAVVMALGGASWPQLGSDGAWTGWLMPDPQGIAPLKPSNCGFDVDWSPHFIDRFAGHPVKPAWISLPTPDGYSPALQGEFVISRDGVEGSLIYAVSARLRDAIECSGPVTITLDLAPGRTLEQVAHQLTHRKPGRSLSETLRRNLGLDGVRAGLVYESAPKSELVDMTALAKRIKALPITLLRARPIAEAISTAGGVRLEALDLQLMSPALPGLFCAGEMLDWDAPTGGYLLAASLASGRHAGTSAARWLTQQ